MLRIEDRDVDFQDSAGTKGHACSAVDSVEVSLHLIRLNITIQETDFSRTWSKISVKTQKSIWSIRPFFGPVLGFSFNFKNP